MRSLSLAAALTAAAPALAADEPPLAEIEVTAEPIGEAEERAPTAFVSEIDVTDRDQALETAAEVLAESVGVQVRRFGGLGAFSTISIRGSSANQVPVFLDGIPLSRAQNETVNLSDLPLDSLQRIDVYRGTIPIGFGGGGIGGAVNLVTRPPSATPATELSAGYGSFETRKVVASHTRRFAGCDVLGHVTYLGSKGDFRYEDDNGTPENPYDDETVTRINNAFDSVDALATVSRDLGGGLSADATQEFFYKDQGVPGPASTQFANPSLRDLRSLTYLRLRQPGFAGAAVDLSGAIFGVYDLQKFDDPDGDFGSRQATRNQTALVGGSTTGTWYGLPYQALTWFTELGYEQFFPFNEFADPENGPDQTRLGLTLALQDEVGLFGDRVVTVPTLRYQHLRDDFSGVDNANMPDTPAEVVGRDLFSPSIGSQVRLQPWLAVRGNIGRYQRAPSFSELFGNAGSVLGNADLVPETGLNRDVGFVTTAPPVAWLDRAVLEYAYFNNDVDDLIVFEAVSPRQFRPENVSSARVRGHELALAAGALAHLGLELNYTHQDSKDLSDIRERRGNQLPLLPSDELYVRGEVFNQRVKLYYEYNYISSNPTDPANFTVVPSRSIHTVGLAAQPLAWLGVKFEAANLTDADVRDLGDFPLPGLSFFGSLKVVL